MLKNHQKTSFYRFCRFFHPPIFIWKIIVGNSRIQLSQNSISQKKTLGGDAHSHRRPSKIQKIGSKHIQKNRFWRGPKKKRPKNGPFCIIYPKIDLFSKIKKLWKKYFIKFKKLIKISKFKRSLKKFWA